MNTLDRMLLKMRSKPDKALEDEDRIKAVEDMQRYMDAMRITEDQATDEEREEQRQFWREVNRRYEEATKNGEPARSKEKMELYIQGMEALKPTAIQERARKLYRSGDPLPKNDNVKLL